MFYGRKGLPVAVISVIDLAMWDLLGKIRNEPVYKLIGGATRERLHFYCTGPEPAAAKSMGFIGAKVPLPYGPDEGQAGLKKNVEFLRKHRESVGPDFPLRVDCYMALNVSYTIEIVKACEDLNIDWWEEVRQIMTLETSPYQMTTEQLVVSFSRRLGRLRAAQASSSDHEIHHRRARVL